MSGRLKSIVGGRTKPSAVVLLSGGMDSVTCLHWAVRAYGAESVRALHVHYGQPHAEPERCAAGDAARAASVPFDVSWSPEAIARGGLTAGGTDAATAVVPGRNAVLLSIAASYGLAWFAGDWPLVLVMGACRDDIGPFPDCRPWALRDMGAALGRMAGRMIEVATPLETLTKAGVLALAGELGAEAAALRSWSCYRGLRSGPCGTCHACESRARAVAEHGLTDDSRYPQIFGGDPARETGHALLFRGR